MKSLIAPVFWGFLFSLTQPAIAGNEAIEGFAFKACYPDACIQVKANQSKRSPLDPSYVFLDPEVSVFPRSSEDALTPKTSFKGESGYYSPETEVVVIEGAKGRNMYVNLSNGRMIWTK